jgi:hypothetical protein
MGERKLAESAPEWEDGVEEIDRFWTSSEAPKEYARLEDVIFLANKGKKISSAVELKKQSIEIKVKGPKADEKQSGIDAFLLIATYEFGFDGRKKQISKVYAFGRAQKGPTIPETDRIVANERLKMDYERLKLAKIDIEEVYFEDTLF